VHCNFVRLCGKVTRVRALLGARIEKERALLEARAKKLEADIRYRTIAWIQIALLAFCWGVPSPAAAAELKAEAAQGYARYVQLTEERMKSEVAPGGIFLSVDGLPEPQRGDTYARLQKGEVVTTRLRTNDLIGKLRTPEALIHHWVGTIFIPGASLKQVLALLQDYGRHDVYYKPEVAQSKTMEHAGDEFKIHYRLVRKKIITVVLDTDYDVHYHAMDAAHAYSESHATRIAEVEHSGEADERDMVPGNDGGFLWRLDSYWRFVDTGHGVFVQCEAISLTRDIPTGLGWLIGPFVESIPRESLAFTLESTRDAVLRGGSRASR
jgi:hypothetical protein